MKFYKIKILKFPILEIRDQTLETLGVGLYLKPEGSISFKYHGNVQPNRTRNSWEQSGKSNGIPLENVPKFRVHNLTP